MFLETIAKILIIGIYILSFIAWPVFIIMVVNASNKILYENEKEKSNLEGE